MAVTVSGQLLYDGNRTGAVGSATAPIANVPIVLQDISGGITNGLMAIVLTSSTGTFQFTNVPAGSYQVVESYGVLLPDGTAPTVIGAIDFGVNAAIGIVLNGGTCPPFSDDVHVYVANPAPTATHLDCIVRNTWLETVGASNVTGVNMLNGPVRYTPMDLGASVLVDPTNLVTTADNGTFGGFSAGATANTGAGTFPANQGPYPELQSQFSYTYPLDSTTVTPIDGHYTIQNIMNNAYSNTHPTGSTGAWWRVADHTTGNEMGRMMVINGYTAGYIVGQTTIDVDSNTDYLTSYWILNLCKQPTGYINPEFSVNILDEVGAILYQHNFTDEIGINTHCPEWIQIGTIFNSGNNNQITIQFISEGGPQTGNDYVLDDVSLNRVESLTLNVTKQSSCSFASPGGTLYYEITIENPTNYYATQLSITDNFTNQFDPDSIMYSVDAGANWDIWTGSLLVDDIPPNGIGILLIRGTVAIGSTGTITNSATVDVTFCDATTEIQEEA